MKDGEFVLEVVRDYFYELGEHVRMRNFNSTERNAYNHTSKRGNNWLIVYRPDFAGQCSLHVKRIQNNWFTWYGLIPLPPHQITLIGFNKHVAQRISQRFNPELNPPEALREMLIKTPAIVQGEAGEQFYTRVNGGICIGSAYGKLISIDIGNGSLAVELRETKTFVSDKELFDDQKEITEASIKLAIEKLGAGYLTDYDQYSTL